MTTIEKLFETKTKNLNKLGLSPAIDIISDYPEEFIRLLMNELEKSGIEIDASSKRTQLNDLRDKITGTSLTRRNPILDTSNQFHLNIEQSKSTETIEIVFNALGNKFIVHRMGMFVSRIPEFTINMKDKSANDIVSSLVEKVLKLKEISKKRLSSREEWEKIRDELQHEDKSTIENIIKKTASKFNIIMSSERENDRIKINLRPNDRKIIGAPEEIIDKTKFRYEHSLKHLYHYDLMEKAWDVIYRIIDNSQYLIITGGLIDYLWIEIEIVNPNRENMKYRIPYKEVHDKMKTEMKNLFDKGRESSDTMSVSDARRKIVKLVIDEDEG